MVFDWASHDPRSVKERFLGETVESICSKPVDQRPHALIAPYGLVYSDIVKKALIKSGDSEYGCNIPTFFHV